MRVCKCESEREIGWQVAVELPSLSVLNPLPDCSLECHTVLTQSDSVFVCICVRVSVCVCDYVLCKKAIERMGL